MNAEVLKAGIESAREQTTEELAAELETSRSNIRDDPVTTAIEISRQLHERKRERVP